ncbi:tol-pal system protein YbgF [Hoeflea marina]|uniref:Cell division coordinator CpoB n=1 Tax=Hoeflea marina TaxID=274592 RepID=A0A317PEQ0_9HYPH|nr:tol-pal system protein YbgF [Hoeflea marina]PWV95505.1 tol-pal system protein YbgF [Hoeflea marina]
MHHLRSLFIAVAVVALAAPASAGGIFSVLSPQRALPPAAVGQSGATVQNVQVSGDDVFRIGQLEEQVRGLNGRIEELGFQLLQMQEQMRQMQEDNEFRFQQLEGGGTAKRSDAGPAVTEPATKQADSSALPGVEDTATASTNPGAGAPPKDIGQIIFDDSGNLVAPSGTAPATGSQTASLGSPEELYQTGYNHVLAGDYPLAEQVFQDYLAAYPEGPQASDAMFWMGEAQFSQARFNEAAKTFLDAHKLFPKADKGPETLLKLGMSLAALNNRDTACATYREVLVSYPGSSKVIRDKVAREQKLSSC